MVVLANLPTLVLGTSAMNDQRSGSCQRGTRSARKARSSSALTAAFSASTTAASGRSPPGGVLGRPRGGGGPLAPLVVGHADDGGLADVRVGHQRVLQLHGGDPLAAGLDHVLGPVGQRDEAERVDGADVAGAQPAVVELAGIVVLVIAAGDPGTADLDLADGHAVVGQHGAFVADQAALDLAHEAAL